VEYKSSFVKGALILSLAGIISKILGALYRIPFARIVGDEGVGLYQMAYPFYLIILAVSTAGIPLAISKLVAERYYKEDFQGIQRVFGTSMAMLLMIGAIASLTLYLGADFIASNILQDPRAALSLKAIAPAILLTSAMATLRGYFQGFQTMTPTALSQIIEQLVRVTTVFVGAFYLLPWGVEYAAAGAIFGTATGGLAGLLLLIFIYLWRKSKYKNEFKNSPSKPLESYPSLAKQIIYLAIPISIGGLVLPLMQTMDALLVPFSLQTAGFSFDEATSLYGQLSGMAGALINLPFIITTALAASLVPAITESLAAGKFNNIKYQFSSALRLALIIVVPASVGLWVLAEPICELLYDLPEAGIPLAWLAPTVLIVGLYQTSTGTLQGLNKPIIPVTSLFLGALVKGILTFTLTALTPLGIKGAALATVIGFLVATFKNIYSLTKILGRQWFKFQDHLLKPLVAVGVMAFGVLFSYKQLMAVGIRNSFSTLLAIALGGFIYFFVLLLIGGITGQDIEKVPKLGLKITKFLRKIKLVRD
jgi:stage V sporulation protein B